MKAMNKKKLAKLAGVSPRTFTRWLVTSRLELEAMGVKYTSHLLLPKAVKYICDEFCIILPENNSAKK